MDIKKINLDFIKFSLSILLLVTLISTSFAKECGGNVSCSCGDSIIQNTLLHSSLSCDGGTSLTILSGNLNCNGFLISSQNNSQNSIGILIQGEKNIQISNCNLSNFDTGIKITQKKVQKGTGWGAIWSEWVPSEKITISNSIFNSNNISINLDKTKNVIVKNSIFSNETEHSIFMNTESSIIYNNIFENKFPKLVYSGKNSFCYENKTNIFLNGSSPECRCIFPEDDLIISENAKFCKGNFTLTKPLRISQGKTLDCNGAALQNEKTNIFTITKSSTKINNCILHNSNIGIQYTSGWISDRYGRWLIPSRYNVLENVSFVSMGTGIIYSVANRGISFGNGYNLEFLNTSTPIRHYGNFLISFSKTLFENISKGEESSISSYTNKISFSNSSIIYNSSNLFSFLKYNQTILKDTSSHMFFEKNVNVYTKDLIKKVYSKLFLEKNLKGNNSINFIFNFGNNSQIISQKMNSTQIISFTFSSCESLKNILDHYHKNSFFYTSKDINYTSQKNFSKRTCQEEIQKNLVINSENIYLNFNQSLVIISNYTIQVNFNNSNTSVYNYSLTRYKNKFQREGNELYFSKTLVLASGLFSTKDSMKEMALYFSKEGFEVFVLELTGGLNECEQCYEYNFSEITSKVFPKYIEKINSLTNNKPIIYIGHSNGARTFLKGISFVKFNTIEMAFLMGTPGSFSDSTLFSNLLIKNKALFSNDSKKEKHVSINSIISSLTDNSKIISLIFKNSLTQKISSRLFLNYINWMNSTKDKQPYNSIEIPKIFLLGGDILTGDDGIVPVKDQEEIFQKINSPFKEKEIMLFLPHTSMIEDSFIFQKIEKTILNFVGEEQ